MKHGSLFSGIGGFDLAAEWMGWDNVFHCEWNPFGQKVLKYYWPKATSYADITKTDFSIHRGAIDILTGGFPCQPYSQAGKRLGKEDGRHLWPEMLRAIREIQPSWIVGENVLGLVNWNGGLVFDEVQAELEAQGYEVQPFVLPACAVGAPHRRDRVWFVARNSQSLGTPKIGKISAIGHCKTVTNSIGIGGIGVSDGNILDVTNSDKIRLQSKKGVNQREKCQQTGDVIRNNFDSISEGGLIANSNSDQRCEGRLHEAGPETSERHTSTRNARSHKRGNWQDFPTQPGICNGDDGLSSRLDGITFSKWRNESIKAGGNAIVPQIALMIFRSIAEYEKLQSV